MTCSFRFFLNVRICEPEFFLLKKATVVIFLNETPNQNKISFFKPNVFFAKKKSIACSEQSFCESFCVGIFVEEGFENLHFFKNLFDSFCLKFFCWEASSFFSKRAVQRNCGFILNVSNVEKNRKTRKRLIRLI